MMRLRLLAGLLGCLAMLTAGLPAAAVASAPAGGGQPVQTADDGMEKQMVASEPGNPCGDCGGLPCPPATAGCTTVCVNAPPVLGTAGPIVPAETAGGTVWPARLAVLNGLSPPPDPFPPRS
ncbi:MAG: hypothetical protein Q8M19_09010 [Reyranella sp.]|nr:hypothetical protein [Reyranella sp.]